MCGRDEKRGDLEVSSFKNALEFKFVVGPIHSMSDFLLLCSGALNHYGEDRSSQSTGYGTFQQCAFLSLIDHIVFKMSTCSNINECLLNTEYS